MIYVLNPAWSSAVHFDAVTVVDEHMVKNVSIVSERIERYEPHRAVEHDKWYPSFPLSPLLFISSSDHVPLSLY